VSGGQLIGLLNGRRENDDQEGKGIQNALLHPGEKKPSLGGEQARNGPPVGGVGFTRWGSGKIARRTEKRTGAAGGGDRGSSVAVRTVGNDKNWRGTEDPNIPFLTEPRLPWPNQRGKKPWGNFRLDANGSGQVLATEKRDQSWGVRGFLDDQARKKATR